MVFIVEKVFQLILWSWNIFCVTDGQNANAELITLITIPSTINPKASTTADHFFFLSLWKNKFIWKCPIFALWGIFSAEGVVPRDQKLIFEVELMHITPNYAKGLPNMFKVYDTDKDEYLTVEEVRTGADPGFWLGWGREWGGGGTSRGRITKFRKAGV